MYGSVNSLIASVLLANSGTRWVRSCHLTGAIGIYAGLLTSPHWLNAVMQDTTDSTALYKASILNIHSVTALIAHALNLTGPAVTLTPPAPLRQWLFHSCLHRTT